MVYKQLQLFSSGTCERRGNLTSASYGHPRTPEIKAQNLGRVLEKVTKVGRLSNEAESAGKKRKR